MKKYLLILVLAFPSIVSKAQEVVTDSITTDLGDFVLETSENESLDDQQIVGDSTTTSDGGNAAYLIGINNGARLMHPQVQIEAVESVTIFPNPTSGITELSLTNFWGSVNITMLDPLGRTVMQNDLVIQGDRSIYIDMSKYDRGVYFVRVASSTTTVTKQLIKN